MYHILPALVLVGSSFCVSSPANGYSFGGMTPHSRVAKGAAEARMNASAGPGTARLGESSIGLGVACSEGPASCQLSDHSPQGVQLLFGATSDGNPLADFKAADNFTAQETGAVSSVCWWGFYIDFQAAGPCSPETVPNSFTITYYLDDAEGTVPGSVLAGPFDVGLPVRVPTGHVFQTTLGQHPEYAYTADHPPVDLETGQCYWIEIRSHSEGTCSWLWVTAPAGDVHSVQDNGNGNYESGEALDLDLAWCIDFDATSDGCALLGACCLDHAETCLEEMTVSTCIAAGGRFLADLTCDDVDPPCGWGGCCSPDGTCSTTSSQGCKGEFHRGLFCQDDGTLLCNAADTCMWVNGKGTPGGFRPASQYAPGFFYAEAADDFVLLSQESGLCPLERISWVVSHFGAGLSGGGCRAGMCVGTEQLCDIADIQACGDFPQDCEGFNPECSNTPDDYAGIRVTIYADVSGNSDPIAPNGHPEVIDGQVTGGHVGEILASVELAPSMYEWTQLEDREGVQENHYIVTMDVAPFEVALETNQRYWLAISPVLPFNAFYQTGWARSENFGGEPPQQVFQLIGILPWTTVDTGTDLAFEINTTPAAQLVSTFPPDLAIDARQPSNLDGADPTGWQHVEFLFDSPPDSVVLADFELLVSGGEAPVIADIILDSAMATVAFDRPIAPGECTTVRHIPSGGQVRLGYLPGDVNEDGLAGSLDLLSLIDNLNGVLDPSLDVWQCDSNRSGVCEPLDILRLIDLLNGASSFDTWNGSALPDCP